MGKYADHNPLSRQTVIFLRDAGIDISRATMCGWVMTIGELLAPVVGAMRRDLLTGSYIQGDETTGTIGLAGSTAFQGCLIKMTKGKGQIKLVQKIRH